MRPHLHFYVGLVEKGTMTPFPIFFSIPLALHSCVTMPSCGSGLGSPHPVEHTGTLTPPIVRRTSVSHSAKDQCASAHHQSGQQQRPLAGAHRQGYASPARRSARSYQSRVCAFKLSTDISHPPFPDALMARHNAGERGVWSGSVPASIPSAGAPSPKGRPRGS